MNYQEQEMHEHKMHEHIKESENKLDLASLFPAKGDDRRPPDWLGRALIYVAIVTFVSIFLWFAWNSISFIVFDVVISIFIALAMEPLVVRLIKHGWRRGVASGFTLTGLLVVISLLLALFGNLFAQQVVSMVMGLPDLYNQFANFVLHYTGFKMPNIEQLGMEILKHVQTSWVVDFAGQALNTTWGLMTVLLDLLTIIMVTYYISAAGPAMRRSMCRWMNPQAQRRFLFIWSVVQEQISSFLFSRIILAAINAVGTAIFLIVMNIPYWLPLSLFCGIVSQFVPTIGGYLGGALPILVAWGSNGFGAAVATLIFITIYQQIENMVISPKISEKTMDLNPAVAFISVLVMGAVFGALGAFLALPVTASLQAIFRVCTKQYSLVSSPLMNDPHPDHTSIIVRCVEAIGRKFMNPMSESVHRVMKGTSSRISLNEDILYWYKQAYVSDSDDANSSKVSSNDSDQTDVLATMPISREILDAVNKDIAKRKVDSENKDSPKAKLQVGESKIVNNTKNNKSNVKNNPRSGWKR
ncbi:AI-2E family transporter [Gardnerella vaginalis]|uniref:AI-2E family transporter n=1 Tax=Gardnerella leopoldii TaxID=2792978 RepID=UPI001572E267|nr:AI-2E family transporter [Gardnerella vaginalis]